MSSESIRSLNNDSAFTDVSSLKWVASLYSTITRSAYYTGTKSFLKTSILSILLTHANPHTFLSFKAVFCLGGNFSVEQRN